MIRELLLRNRDAAGGIYGTILATSVVVGLSGGTNLHAAAAMEVLLSSMTVFWLAHVYARFLASKAERHDLGFEEFVTIALFEWPVLRACLPAALAIFFWWVGLTTSATAFWIAVGLGVGELAILGFVLGRRSGQSVLLATGTAALDAALGGVLVLVKAFVG